MRLYSNEIVFRGHPDKVCDQISDALLDAYLKEDINSRCGIEVMGGKGKIFITGEVTSKGNVNILSFARFLDRENKKMWIRHVIVPTINLDDESLKETKKFIDTLKNVEKVEILPYHTMGIVKYEQLNIPYPLKGVRVPTEEEISHAKEILKR